MKNIFVFVAFVFLAASASAQTGKPIKVLAVYSTSDASSAAVGPLLVRQIAAQPKFFTVVNGDDKDLAIITDCYRETPNDPYSCYYVATKWIGSNEALLLAGRFLSRSRRKKRLRRYSRASCKMSQNGGTARIVAC